MSGRSAALGTLYVVFDLQTCQFVVRRGRVVRNQVSQAIDLGCTEKQYDTPLAALVAPNGSGLVLLLLLTFFSDGNGPLRQVRTDLSLIPDDAAAAS